MTPQSLLSTLEDQSLMVPIGFSLVAGLLIGIERELRGKPAGMRTHALVCVASAMMTLVGLRMDDWASVLPEGAMIVTDMARMPHAILTGIGFLGAGVIFREGPSVQGLTTAATLWMTAALGIIFGAGLLELGVIGTMAALLVLILFRQVQRVMPPKPVIRLDVVVPQTSTLDGTQLTTALAGIGLTAGPISLAQDIGLGLRRYKLMAAGQDQRIDCDAVASALRSTADLQKLTVVPLDRDTGT